ncbi:MULTISPECIES: hypothetical protein [unclassified Pseudomonas]|uniref:hypothetical protein n=1 Tax=unclassified Pseudomonas TaxID=196821 RepID=UPI0021153F32|nr:MULTISPECIES: hypothetical protein [unclassified Pseudomonas]
MLFLQVHEALPSDDLITVTYGMADGGEGNDLLTGTGTGWANGGEGDDTYTVNTRALVSIQDDGASRGDTVVLSFIRSTDLLADRVGDDLYLHESKFVAGQTPQEGVLLKDWFAGSATIEQIQTATARFFSRWVSSFGFVESIASYSPFR